MYSRRRAPLLAALVLGACVCSAHVLPSVVSGSAAALNTNASSPSHEAQAGGAPAGREGVTSWLKSTRCTMGQESEESRTDEPDRWNESSTGNPAGLPTQPGDDSTATLDQPTTCDDDDDPPTTTDPDCDTAQVDGAGGGDDNHPNSADTTGAYEPPPRPPGVAFFYVDDS